MVLFVLGNLFLFFVNFVCVFWFCFFFPKEYLNYNSSEQKCGGCKEHLIPGLQHFTERTLRAKCVVYRSTPPITSTFQEASSCCKNGLKLSGLSLHFLESKTRFCTQRGNVTHHLLPHTKCPVLLFVCGYFTSRKMERENVQIQKCVCRQNRAHVPIPLQTLLSAVITNTCGSKKPEQPRWAPSRSPCARNVIRLLFKTCFRAWKYFSVNAVKVKPAQIICCVSTTHMNEICPGTMNLATDLS